MGPYFKAEYFFLESLNHVITPSQSGWGNDCVPAYSLLRQQLPNRNTLGGFDNQAELLVALRPRGQFCTINFILDVCAREAHSSFTFCFIIFLHLLL